MIVSFKDRRTEDIFNGTNSRHTRNLDKSLLKVAVRRLDILNYAAELADLLMPPGNKLEPLKGKLKGFYSIRVNSQWRLIFRWEASGPAEVEFVDYHS